MTAGAEPQVATELAAPSPSYQAGSRRGGARGALKGMGTALQGVWAGVEMLATIGEFSVILLLVILVPLALFSWSLGVPLWLIVLMSIVGLVVLGGIIGHFAEPDEPAVSPGAVGPAPAPAPAAVAWGLPVRHCPQCGSPNILVAAAPLRQIHCNGCGRDSAY